MTDQPNLFDPDEINRSRLRAAGWREDDGTKGLAFPMWWAPDNSEKLAQAEALRRLDASND